MSRKRPKKKLRLTRERTTARNPYPGLLRRAHDIRHLAMCSLCGKPALENVLLEAEEGRVHVECFVARRGELALLALPREERNKVRICQVSDGLLARILERHGSP